MPKTFEQLFERLLEMNVELLTEMFVVGDIPSDNTYILLAHRSKLWILGNNPDQNSKTFRDIENTLGVHLQSVKSIPDLAKQLEDQVKHRNNELLLGNMVNGELEIMDYNPIFVQDHVTSNLCKKVLLIIKPHYIKYNSNPTTPTIGWMAPEKNGELKHYYHGTCLTYLESIINTGISGDTINSNWSPEVKEKNKGHVCMTSNLAVATGHAYRTANNNESVPIVVEFQVRFDDLLQSDYDLGRIYGKKGLSVSKSVGILAYKGRIPPYDITQVYFFTKPSSIIPSDWSSHMFTVPFRYLWDEERKGITPEQSYDHWKKALM